jgi:hypothetical protein
MRPALSQRLQVTVETPQSLAASSARIKNTGSLGIAVNLWSSSGPNRHMEPVWEGFLSF